MLVGIKYPSDVSKGVHLVPDAGAGHLLIELVSGLKFSPRYGRDHQQRNQYGSHGFPLVKWGASYINHNVPGYPAYDSSTVNHHRPSPSCLAVLDGRGGL